MKKQDAALNNIIRAEGECRNGQDLTEYRKRQCKQRGDNDDDAHKVQNRYCRTLLRAFQSQVERSLPQQVPPVETVGRGQNPRRNIKKEKDQITQTIL
jgi:hypothetical protein